MHKQAGRVEKRDQNEGHHSGATDGKRHRKARQDCSEENYEGEDERQQDAVNTKHLLAPHLVWCVRSRGRCRVLAVKIEKLTFTLFAFTIFGKRAAEEGYRLQENEGHHNNH